MAKVSTNDLGLLDPGIHLMTLDEVEELFGRFQLSDRRMDSTCWSEARENNPQPAWSSSSPR
jgi:hypothetical protein